jgi:hypothetical protein
MALTGQNSYVSGTGGNQHFLTSFPEAVFGAPAAKAHFVRIRGIGAVRSEFTLSALLVEMWCSNRTNSLCHHCQERPRADIRSDRSERLVRAQIYPSLHRIK